MTQLKQEATVACDNSAEDIQRYLSLDIDEFRSLVSQATIGEIDLLKSVKSAIAQTDFSDEKKKLMRRYCTGRMQALTALQRQEPFVTESRGWRLEYKPGKRGFDIRAISPHGITICQESNWCVRTDVEILGEQIISDCVSPQLSPGKNAVVIPLYYRDAETMGLTDEGINSFDASRLEVIDQLLRSFQATTDIQDLVADAFVNYKRTMEYLRQNEEKLDVDAARVRASALFDLEAGWEVINEEMGLRTLICNSVLLKGFVTDPRQAEIEELSNYVSNRIRYHGSVVFKPDGLDKYVAYLDCAVFTSQFFSLNIESEIFGETKIPKLEINSAQLQELKNAWKDIPIVIIGQQKESLPEAETTAFDYEQALRVEKSINEMFVKGTQAFSDAKQQLLQIDRIIRQQLIEMDCREGYRVLGFDSMSDYMASGRIKRSRSTLQKQWHSGKLEAEWGLEVGTLAEKQCHALKVLPPETARTIAENIAEAIASGFSVAEAFKHAIEPHKDQIPTKTPKTKSRRVVEKDGTVKFELNIAENKYDIPISEFGEKFTRFEQQCAQTRKTPEGLISEKAIATLATMWGCSEPAAIARLMGEATNLIEFPIAG